MSASSSETNRLPSASTFSFAFCRNCADVSGRSVVTPAERSTCSCLSRRMGLSAHPGVLTDLARCLPCAIVLPTWASSPLSSSLRRLMCSMLIRGPSSASSSEVLRTAILSSILIFGSPFFLFEGLLEVALLRFSCLTSRSIALAVSLLTTPAPVTSPTFLSVVSPLPPLLPPPLGSLLSATVLPPKNPEAPPPLLSVLQALIPPLNPPLPPLLVELSVATFALALSILLSSSSLSCASLSSLLRRTTFLGWNFRPAGRLPGELLEAVAAARPRRDERRWIERLEVAVVGLSDCSEVVAFTVVVASVLVASAVLSIAVETEDLETA